MAEAAFAQLLRLGEPRLGFGLGRLRLDQLGVELGQLLGRDTAAVVALVEAMAAPIVLDRLVGLAHLLAQLGDAAEQELVDAIEGRDLLLALIVEIGVGKRVGDRRRGGSVARLGLDAQHMRAAEQGDIDLRQQDVDHPIVAQAGIHHGSRLDLRRTGGQLVEPFGHAGGHELIEAEHLRPERRLAQLGIELRIVGETKLVDHHLGERARLQDEAFVLHALRVGIGVGDDRLGRHHAWRLNADQHACLRHEV